jgi:hypothetical protein
MAEPPGPGRPFARHERWLFPERAPGESGEWLPALAPERAPWSLRERDAPFRWREMPEVDGLVVELRQNNDAPERRIADFLAEVEARLRARPARTLVLDMRWNGGGNLTTTRALAQWLPAHVGGRIFVLTSPWTFSAAISTIGYLEQAAPDRVTIVGEPVGDRLDFFAEGGLVTLPHSGLVLSYSTARHDYRNGCRERTDCHPPVVRYPIAVPTLEPDLPTPWTIEAYLAGRDPAIEAASQALRK